MTSAPTRRTLLGAIAMMPAAASAASFPVDHDDLSRLTSAPHEALFAELDAIDAATARINSIHSSQPEWDAWEEWTDRVWKDVENLPATPENAKLKARAIWSIVNGQASEINEGVTTVCRLVRQVISSLNEKGC